jgi:hypothetical protein
MTSLIKRGLRAPVAPSSLSFSNTALRKAVLAKSTNHPLTLFPITIGLLATVAIAILGPLAATLSTAVGAFTIGIGNGIINYFFRWDKHANAHLTELTKKMTDYRNWSKTEIKRVLLECESMGGVGQYAARGRKQYDEINGKFALLREILAKKLNPGELTHIRYLGSAQQVYLNILDNLRDLVNHIKGIAAIGDNYRKDLKRLEGIRNPSKTEKKQLATLLERDALRRSQQDKVTELLTLNERALTKIDATIAAFAGTRTRGGEADVDIETAIAELASLSAKVQKYAASR